VVDESQRQFQDQGGCSSRLRQDKFSGMFKCNNLLIIKFFSFVSYYDLDHLVIVQLNIGAFWLMCGINI